MIQTTKSKAQHASPYFSGVGFAHCVLFFVPEVLNKVKGVRQKKKVQHSKHSLLSNSLSKLGHFKTWKHWRKCVRKTTRRRDHQPRIHPLQGTSIATPRARCCRTYWHGRPSAVPVRQGGVAYRNENPHPYQHPHRSPL